MTAKKMPAQSAAKRRGHSKADAPLHSQTTRAEMLIRLMRAEGGASAAELAAAVGWQVHSVRGFVAGTLKKRADVTVVAVKVDGVTRYRVRDAGTVA